MEVTAVHASPTATPLRRRALRGLAIGSAAAFLLAFVGALGTDQAPMLQRLAYWAAVILPGTVLGLAMQALVRGWGALSRRPIAEVALVALLVALPHTFLVIVASALFFGPAAITGTLVLEFFAAVLVLSLVLTAINRLAAGQNEAGDLPHVPEQPAPPEIAAGSAPHEAGPPALPALLREKLPPRLRAGRLIAIEAEDHYLRVHTDCGSDLVLMRMVDACALLDERDGMRVHRSWWVARAAVTLIERQGGKMELRLTNGSAAPVARTMHRRLREAGWGQAEG